MKDDLAGTYEKFLTEIRGQNSLSTDELAGQIGHWRTIKDSVFYYAVRDTAGNQHSTMYAKCQLLHDSLRTKFARLALSRKRDFHDVFVLIEQTSPCLEDKVWSDAADKARPFFSSLDSLAPSDTNRSVILTKYHRQLARVLQRGIHDLTDLKTFIRNEDVMFALFLHTLTVWLERICRT